MMRFLLLLFLLYAPSVLAQEAATTAPANPVDALKQSLHKQTDVSAAVKKEEPVVPTWMSLPREQRQQILAMWQNMPETTRPPFPIFRDTMLDKACKPTPEHAARLTPKSSLIRKK